MDKKIMLGVIVVVVLVAGLLMFRNMKNPAMTQNTVPEAQDDDMSIPAGTGPKAKAENTISIENFAFNPATLTVKVGDMVDWVNKDTVVHTATADDNSFDTGALSTNQSGSYSFTKPGTYTYYCASHPNMKGTVIVK